MPLLKNRKPIKQIPNYEEFNSKNLRDYWIIQIKEKRNIEYQPHSFGGNELHLFKNLLDDYDIFSILCAIDAAIDDNIENIKYLSNMIKEYVPLCNYHKLMFFAKHHGSLEIRRKWYELVTLDSFYSPDAKDERRKNSIIQELEDWVQNLK